MKVSLRKKEKQVILYFFKYISYYLVLLLPNTFRLFGFPISSFWVYLMKVILSVPDEGYFECAWWRLFQKCVIYTKFDIYIFISCHMTSLPVYLWSVFDMTIYTVKYDKIHLGGKNMVKMLKHVFSLRSWCRNIISTYS